jgi:hypothetical protein
MTNKDEAQQILNAISVNIGTDIRDVEEAIVALKAQKSIIDQLLAVRDGTISHDIETLQSVQETSEEDIFEQTKRENL